MFLLQVFDFSHLSVFISAIPSWTAVFACELQHISLRSFCLLAPSSVLLPRSLSSFPNGFECVSYVYSGTSVNEPWMQHSRNQRFFSFTFTSSLPCATRLPWASSLLQPGRGARGSATWRRTGAVTCSMATCRRRTATWPTSSPHWWISTGAVRSLSSSWPTPSRGSSLGPSGTS